MLDYKILARHRSRTEPYKGSEPMRKGQARKVFDHEIPISQRESTAAVNGSWNLACLMFSRMEHLLHVAENTRVGCLHLLARIHRHTKSQNE